MELLNIESSKLVLVKVAMVCPFAMRSPSLKFTDCTVPPTSAFTVFTSLYSNVPEELHATPHAIAVAVADGVTVPGLDTAMSTFTTLAPLLFVTVPDEMRLIVPQSSVAELSTNTRAGAPVYSALLSDALKSTFKIMVSLSVISTMFSFVFTSSFLDM